ncbi:MAG: hypothetical protein EHM64_00035 [Ignavibacteriae bacterium]|nr:MAG: hypothetical protein EHM64_00035 [Ignavibacteriota bacterium]
MGRLIITPSKATVYPNNGGYTGISICVWDTRYNSPDKYILENPWGSVEGTKNLKKSKYVFEARFFVFGSLLQRFLIAKDSWEDLTQKADNLFLKWKPLMDEIVSKEKQLWKEPGRTGVHRDDVVTADLWLRLRSD